MKPKKLALRKDALTPLQSDEMLRVNGAFVEGLTVGGLCDTFSHQTNTPSCQASCGASCACSAGDTCCSAGACSAQITCCGPTYTCTRF